MENIKKGKIDIDRYRVKENEKVNLKKVSYEAGCGYR